METNKLKGIVCTALCILSWSLIPVFAKFTQSQLDHYQYLFYSSIVSFILIFVVTLYRQNLKEVFTYSKKILLVLFGLGFLNFLDYLLLYFGYKNANGLEVLIIQYMWPIFVVFFSPIILKEEFTKKKVFSVTLGFFGIILVITKGEFSSLNFSKIDILLAVMLGSISFALFSVLSKAVRINGTNAVMVYFFSAILYSIIAVSSYSNFISPSFKDWIGILINGIFVNGISYLFWIKALQIFDASKLAPFLFITPFLSAFFLIIFFGEPALPIYFIGLFFVILSGLISNLKTKP